MDPEVRTAEEIATRAHGVVTRAELLAAGMSATQLRTRVRSRMLIPVYRGVYRLGHRAPSVAASYMAAVKACGGGAVLSGLAAAYLLGLVKGKPPPPEIMTPTERRIPGLKTIRSRRVEPRDTTVNHGIPVTSVPRTLVDIASSLPLQALSRACHERGCATPHQPTYRPS